MQFFLQQLISGLANGGIFALVALGFALIFGVSNVLNIAHTQTIMLGPALAVVVSRFAGLDPVTSLAVGFLGTVVVAVVIHVIAVQPFVATHRRVDHLAPLIATFGISMVIEFGMAKIIGTTGTGFPLSLPREVWVFPGGIKVDPVNAISLLAALVVVAGLTVVVARTNFGRSMRAVAENREVAESLGVPATRTIVLTTILAGALGAAAGLLFAAGSNSVTPFMGLTYGLTGLVALIVGGVTSLGGSVAAALLIGVLQAMINGYGAGNYSDITTFGLLILVLLVRPRGLVSMAVREARP